VEKSTEPNQEGLAVNAAQIYQSSQHNKANEAPIGPDKVGGMNCIGIAADNPLLGGSTCIDCNRT